MPSDDWVLAYKSFFVPRIRNAVLLWYNATASTANRNALRVVLRGVGEFGGDAQAIPVDPDTQALFKPFRRYVAQSSHARALAWLKGASSYERGLFQTAMKAIVDAVSLEKTQSTVTVSAIPELVPRKADASSSLGKLSIGKEKPRATVVDPIPAEGNATGEAVPHPALKKPSKEAADLNMLPADLFPRSNKHKPSRHLWDGKPPYAKLDGKFEDRTTFNEYFHPIDVGEPPVIMSRRNPSCRMNRGGPPFARVGTSLETSTAHSEAFSPVARAHTSMGFEPPTIMSRKRPARHSYDKPAPYAKILPVQPLSPALPEPTDLQPQANGGSRFPGVARRLLDGDYPYARLGKFVNLTTSNTFSRHYNPSLSAAV
eukprot:NODE_501_length_1426_cov_92.519630_g467_i0.p1 GENE.NODE_501_length_1426_cov_92.519630_g467_i0~~NODE_501_length_1426_cov_92.519630_g467_i0.p1  ORF type:complete len:372 (+),score=44.75 NODE_501_length_1426_cov_92.519630_g467_i0:96-1211(+)